MRRAAIAGAMVAVAVMACGGSAGGGGTPTEPGGPATANAPSLTAAPATTAVTPAPATQAAAASLPAGPVSFRVVNLSPAAVDVHLRSQGLVQAVPGVLALAPGAVSEPLSPPDPGEVVVLPAGTGDPVCVAGCDFLAQATTVGGEGTRRILVVRDGDATEFWEDPEAASVGKFGNALRPADPSLALVIVDAGGVVDGKFGLNVAWTGTTG
jgi:hypothetical protein